MSDLMSSFTAGLQGEAVKQISKRLGIDENIAQTAISVGLPMILSGMAKNTQNEDGAKSLNNALEKDHDGGIWDNVTGFLSNETVQATGMGILKHVFGGKQEAAEKNVSKSTGLDTNTAGQVMQMLAPVVMGYLSKKKNEEGLDATGVANMLNSNQEAMSKKAPKAMGMISQFLDADGDGDVTDDLLDMGQSFLGSFFDKDKKDK